MKKTYDDLPGWEFDIREVSVGVYLVHATDRLGRTVQGTDFDPDKLLERARAKAAEISGQVLKRGPSLPT